MKNIIFWFFLIAVLSVSSCKTEDARPTNFEIEVDQAYLANGEDGWIFFHDSNGKLLDSKQISNGQNYKFNTLSTPEQKVGVTLAKIYKTSARVESFLSVETPVTWTLLPTLTESWSCGDSAGSLEVTVQDTDLSTNPLDASFSDSHVFIQPPSTTTVTNSLPFPAYTMRKDCDDDFFLFILDKNGVPHYKFLENILSGKKTYSLADFSNFDRTLRFDFPACTQVYLTISATDGGATGKRFTTYNSQTNGNSRSTMTAAYLNRFQKYKTRFGAGYFTHTFSYEEMGTIPTSIALPLTFNPVITDKRFGGFTFSVNESFVYRNTIFYYFPTNGDMTIDWRISASKDNDSKNLVSLPSSFVAKYPGFRMENLSHNSTEFFTQSEDMIQVIAQRFRGSEAPGIYKHVSKIIYN